MQLLRKSHVIHAEKLRTILLLEADFNMNNKALGSRIMRIGERHQVFSKDNYGGQHGHCALEVGLNACLTQDSV